jgi:hypothetical protein
MIQHILHLLSLFIHTLICPVHQCFINREKEKKLVTAAIVNGISKLPKEMPGRDQIFI